ncbi:MAG TPA: dual specificity protein phosphatase family protein [Acidimicrobiia bacterium]
MRARLFTITRDGAGRLSTMRHPAGGSALGGEMRRLGTLGVDTLVSMLTEREAARLGLGAEPTCAESYGMSFVACPVHDHGVPHTSVAELLALRLARALEDDGHVVIHCRQGIGRSSLLAAATLTVEGIDAGEAWRKVEQARGCSVPETRLQRQWLTSFVAARSAPAASPGAQLEDPLRSKS